MELTVQAAPRYNDVPMSHEAFAAIENLSDQGVVSGYGDGSFRPDTPVTRAQLAKTLALALHWGVIKPDEPRFSDVPVDSWMYPFVETAAARNVMLGYSDGAFRPNANLSRGEALAYVATAAGWKSYYAPSAHFLDVNNRHRLYSLVEAAYSKGAIAPDADGNFYPYAPASRAFVSVLAHTMLIEKMTEIPPGLLDDQGPEQ
jgi:hypothetical protein